MDVSSLFQKFTLVVPTLNEAENLPLLLDRVREALLPTGLAYEILVVDDNSQDGTHDTVHRLALRDPRIRLIVRRGARGLATAVVHGWQNTDADLLGVMDADLQHPPELLPALLGEAIDHDLVVASRYVESKSVRGWNALRATVSRLSTALSTPLLRRVRVKDPMSGYFVLRRSVIAHAHLEPVGFKILLEVLVRGRIGSVKEVPFHFGLRHAGKSKADARVAWQYVSQLRKLSRHSLFGAAQR
jgi:dolichol-phosphate mannosyltransferase